MSTRHKWTFFRAGGFDQVKLESGADLMNLDMLDQTLWVALACPTSGLEIDPRTLALIDTDKNGRVRAGELIAAVKFAGSALKNPDDLLRGEPALPLAALENQTPEGKVIIFSARHILDNIGKKDAVSISVADVSDRTRIFADTAFNGDGVITEISASNEAELALVREIMDCIGSVPDLSSKPGITAVELEAFFTEAKAHVAWMARGEADAKSIFPLGTEGTAAASQAIQAVKAKVDDYFGRCRLAAYDVRTEHLLNRREEEYQVIASKDLSLSAAEVSAFPMAQVGAGKPLPMSGPVNPAHAAALAALSDVAVKPLLGARDRITEAEWLSLLAMIAPFQAWEAAETGLRVEKLGRRRIAEILASDLEAALLALIAKDKALEAEIASIDAVEKLVHYYRDLALLCTNFVNFKDFYDRSSPSIFQNGTLYLDQRACGLCLKVEDAAKHAQMAGLAGAYLAYLDCTRKETGEKMQIVAAFTAGDSDNLMVGRNGIFYDRKGKDWDATIARIVDNPISLRQAFWSPYKKFVRYLEEQVTKRAAAADAEADKALNAAALTTAHVDKSKTPEPKKLDVGTVAALAGTGHLPAWQMGSKSGARKPGCGPSSQITAEFPLGIH